MDWELVFWVLAAVIGWVAFIAWAGRPDWTAWRKYHARRADTDEFNKDTWKE